MNNEEMSEMIQKLSSMINQTSSSNSSSENTQEDISSNSNNTSSSDNLQTILSNINFDSEGNENTNQDSKNNFNLDFETMMKIKNIMDTIQSTKNSPEANLLLSLKPYLNNNRKQKLDQYMQFLNIAKVIENFNSNGGVNNK